MFLEYYNKHEKEGRLCYILQPYSDYMYCHEEIKNKKPESTYTT